MQTTLLLPNNLVKGVFVQEIKNRFLCEVLIDGECVVCYIPSSCRLSNFIDLEGKEVLLKPNQDPHARTKYAVFAVKYRRNYLLLNTSMANRIVETVLSRRYFSGLGKRNNVVRERVIDSYKCDLFIENTSTIVEVKSLISLSKVALFPTVFSQRAIDQLEKIIELQRQGFKVAYIFVSLNPYVDVLHISGDEHFKALFKECVSNGMQVYGINIMINQNEIRIKSKLPVVV